MIYINDKHNVTHALIIKVHDKGEAEHENWACWSIDDGTDIRYVEAHVDSELWDVIALAAKAYEDEEE